MKQASLEGKKSQDQDQLAKRENGLLGMLWPYTGLKGCTLYSECKHGLQAVWNG